MTGDTFLRKLGDIDEKFIIEAAPGAQGTRKNTGYVRWLAVAAGIGIIAGLALAAPRMSKEPDDVTEPPTGTDDPATNRDTPQTPDSEPTLGPAYSAEELGELFNGAKRNDGAVATKAYTEVFVPDVKYLYASGEVPGTVTMYNLVPPAEADGAELRAMVQGPGAALAAAAGMDLAGAKARVDTDAAGPSGGLSEEYDDGRLLLMANQDGWSDTLTLFVWPDRGTLSLGELPVAADQRLEDGELLRALEPVREELFKALGVSFPDAAVVRQFYEWSEYGVATLCVYYYDGSVGTAVPDGTTAPMGDYIMLDFDNIKNWEGDNVSTGVLDNVTVRYVARRGVGKYVSYGKNPAIGLERAEEYLNKGWVFGGHSCPLCMAEQGEVSFDGYDAVKLVYVEGGEDLTELVPFYAFFKAIRTTDGGTVYARTYVPAVEVSGLEEYFNAQQQFHSSAVTVTE